MVDKLKSRKLWITILTVAALIVAGRIDAAVNVIMMYLGAQGVVDATAILVKKKTT